MTPSPDERRSTTTVARHERAMRLAYTSPDGYHGPDSYRRWRDGEDPAALAESFPPARTAQVCAAPGCETTDVHGRGLCHRHYVQWWRRDGRPGRIVAERTPPPPSEVTEECWAAYRALVAEVGR